MNIYKLSDFDYNLPPELIAQAPAKPRDHSRLLIMDKINGTIEHEQFFNIIDYLNKGDILVLNNTKVFPARLLGKKELTGGKMEIFLLKRNDSKKEETWECLVGGGGKKDNLKIILSKNLNAILLKNNLDGTWIVKFNLTGKKFDNAIKKIGHVPLPPYIKKDDTAADKKSYQTVYADNKKSGSTAAPTAGLHFTKNLLNKLKKKGVKFAFVTLHVGLGTFAPVKTENLAEHKMHSEWIEIKKKELKKIIAAKKSGGRVISVGTTSVRALESFFSKKTKPENYSGFTNIFILPGYKFNIIDGLITNFHLPKSTLLMLVSALAGKNNIAHAYKEAIKNNYRFFSYGDVMFIK